MLTPQRLAYLQAEKIRTAVLSTIADYEKQMQHRIPDTGYYSVSVDGMDNRYDEKERDEIVTRIEQDFQESGWDYVRTYTNCPGTIAYQLTPRK